METLSPTPRLRDKFRYHVNRVFPLGVVRKYANQYERIMRQTHDGLITDDYLRRLPPQDRLDEFRRAREVGTIVDTARLLHLFGFRRVQSRTIMTEALTAEQQQAHGSVAFRVRQIAQSQDVMGISLLGGELTRAMRDSLELEHDKAKLLRRTRWIDFLDRIL